MSVISHHKDLPFIFGRVPLSLFHCDFVEIIWVEMSIQFFIYYSNNGKYRRAIALIGPEPLLQRYHSGTGSRLPLWDEQAQAGNRYDSEFPHPGDRRASVLHNGTSLGGVDESEICEPDESQWRHVPGVIEEDGARDRKCPLYSFKINRRNQGSNVSAVKYPQE